jgi:hypothetical protein
VAVAVLVQTMATIVFSQQLLRQAAAMVEQTPLVAQQQEMLVVQAVVVQELDHLQQAAELELQDKATQAAQVEFKITTQ